MWRSQHSIPALLKTKYCSSDTGRFLSEQIRHGLIVQGKKKESKKESPTSSCGLSANGHTFLLHVPRACSPLSVRFCFPMLPWFPWRALDPLLLRRVVQDLSVVVPQHRVPVGNLLKSRLFKEVPSPPEGGTLGMKPRPSPGFRATVLKNCQSGGHIWKVMSNLA